MVMMKLEDFHGLLTSAVVKVAHEKLGTVIGDFQVTMPEAERQQLAELAELQATMEGVAEDLEAMERRSVSGASDTRDCLMQLRNAAYGIWDMVDEIQANKRATMAGTSAPRRTAIKQAVNKIKNQLEAAGGLLRVFVSIWSPRRETVHSQRRRTTPRISMAVGREEETQRILHLLLSPDVREGFTVLPICGLPSVGKTTLAQLVYNRMEIKEHYSLRCWVYVSEDFDLERIGRQILLYMMGFEGASQSQRYGPDGMSFTALATSFRKLLRVGRRVLIVLDDVWEHEDSEWDRLKLMLDPGNSRSMVTVIVTTRDEGIARKICTNDMEPYKLHPLSDDMCWELIMQQTDIEVWHDKQELVKIGRVLAAKCQGLPLAAQVLGRRMRSDMSIGTWSTLLHDHDYPNHMLLDEFIGASILLSYQSMPLDLRLCFAYCGTLPDRHNIAKHDLIHRWLALGLIEPYGGISTRYQRGEEYIRRLLDISFLQPANFASTSGKDDRGATMFTMNNLFHALARSIIDAIMLVVDGENLTSYQKKQYRYALLNNFGVAPLKSMLSDELSQLRLLSCSKTDVGHLNSFPAYLQVLELRECSMQRLPDSITQLRQLGYLNLSACSGLVMLPKAVGDLTGVVHINLSGCIGLQTLPKSIGNLKNLVHINLPGCIGLQTLPESIGNLKNLVHINLSGCVGLKTLPESFRVLEKLEYLDLSSCSCLEGVPSALEGLANLRYLDLSHPCCYVPPKQRFHLDGLKDVWVKLINLRYLNLSMCLNHILCCLQEVQRTDYIGEYIRDLCSLEHLDLSHNIFLSDLPKSLRQLTQLQTLNLSGCARLKKIDTWLSEMSSLKSVVVRNCRSLETYQFVVHADDTANSSNLVQLNDISCKDLEISCLQKVKSAGEAKNTMLAEKKLKRLSLEWTNGSEEDKDLLEELVPPQNLQCFKLHGYGSEFLPAWLTSGAISSHLPNLVEVTMEEIPTCSSLPELGRLLHLKRLVLRKMAKITRIRAGDMSGGNKAAFLQLLHVTLDHMENLEEFNTHYDSDKFMFPTLDELAINNCPKLRFGPFPPKARISLISGCAQLLSKEMREHALEGPSSSTCISSAPVTELVIESCKVPPVGLKRSLLQGLPPLHALHFRNCDDQTLPEEIISALSSVQLLCFSRCKRMTYLPHYLDGLTGLTELIIDECRGIKLLPQNVIDKDRKPRPVICIRECPELKKWCESEKRELLSHIQFKYE